MKKLSQTKQFSKDIRLMRKRGKDLSKMESIGDTKTSRSAASGWERETATSKVIGYFSIQSAKIGFDWSVLERTAICLDEEVQQMHRAFPMLIFSRAGFPW